MDRVSGITYAAVAANISVLELVPCVRKIRRTANMTAKPVMHKSRSRVPETCVSTAIATTGIKHAITVVRLDVKRRAAFSETNSRVSVGFDLRFVALWDIACVFSASGTVEFIFRFPSQTSVISHHKGMKWYATHLVKPSILAFG